MKRVGIYCRVSTEEQALHGYSLEAQLETCEKFCTDNGYKIAGRYIDEGVSGGKPARKRPEMTRLLHDVELDKIDLIIFVKLDRWFRNTKEYYKTQEILEAHHCDWKTILEDFDTSTANGRLIIGIMLSIAQQELERTSERIKFVFDNKVSKGEFIQGHDPIGYKRTRVDGKCVLMKDPDTQDAVQAFWDALISTHNLRSAIKAADDAGLHLSYKQGDDLFRLGTYCTGSYKGNDHYCEPYISKEQYDFCKSYHVKKTQKGRSYLFTGLLICPVCGRKLCSSFRPIRKDDRYMEYYNYRCNKNQRGHECSFNRSISEMKIEKQLLDNLQVYYDQYVALVEVEQKEKRQKAVNASAVREKMRRISAAYIAGAYNDDEYNELIVQCKKQLEVSEQVVEEPKNLDSVKHLLETDFISMYKSLTPSEAQRFWRELIDKVIIGESGIERVYFRS